MKKIAVLIFGLFVSATMVNAQTNLEQIKENEKTKAAADAATDGWKKTAAFGLNLDQIAMVNPRPGDGLNRIGFGANGLIGATMKKGRLYWDNGISETFGMQKLGRGTNIPLQKSGDELKAWSGLGYQAKENGKWFYMLDARLKTQLTPSYAGTGTYGSLIKYNNEYTGTPDSIYNALTAEQKATAKGNALQSKFLSPGYLTIAPGVSYIPNTHFDLFLSPAAMNVIIVNDDYIASRVNPGDSTRSLYGTKWRSPTDYDKTEVQVGAMARARYNNKYFNDKVTFRTELILYSNYLHNPKNIDVEWNNDLGFTIYKGLSLNLKASMYYDDDQIVMINRDNNIATGTNGNESFGKRVRMVEGLFITYTKNF